MKLKTLLLGSAGALAVFGGAQAADLSVAEPVEYVKVCDAFGAGYWYIPGTDTCLKIGGYVQMDLAIRNEHQTLGDGSSYNFGTGAYHIANNHSATWEFKTEAAIQVTAKSMTEYGPLTGYIDLRAKSDNAQAGPYLGLSPAIGAFGASTTSISDNYLSTDKYAYIDTAWLELGPLLVGRAASLYDYGGGLANYDGSSYDSDAVADQVRLTWAMSGFGVALGIEDPRDRWGTSLSHVYHMPNIIGAITATQGHWDGKLSVGYANTAAGSGFGVQAATTIKLDEIAKGDSFRFKAAWAQNEVSSFAASNSGSDSQAGFPGISVLSGGSTWSLLASFQHFWAPTLYSSITANYANQGAGTTIDYPTAFGVMCSALPGTSDGCMRPGGGFDVWSVYANLVWAPVTGFTAGVEGGYVKASTNNGQWSAKVRVKRAW